MIDSVLRPIVSAVVSGVAGSSSATPFDPADLFSGRSAGSWHYGWDNTDLKVNSDGTGGSVASGGTVGRWDDRSGFGNHINQATANIRPAFRTDEGVSFFWATETTTRQARLGNTSTDAVPRTDCSGGIVFDAMACSTAAVLDLADSTTRIGFALGVGDGADSRFVRYHNGAALVSTGLIYTGRKNVLTWRSNGSDFIVRVNGSEYTLGSALGAVDMTRLWMGTFNGGAPKPARIFESLVFDYDIGAENLTSLETYLNTNAANDSIDTTKVVAVFGDSLSCSVGSETGKQWHDYVTNRSTSRWYNFSADGGFIHVPHISATNMAALKSTGEAIAILWCSTNGINLGVQTGLQCAASTKTYADTLSAAGWSVIVCNSQELPANDAEAVAFNAQLVTDSASYDAIVDLRTAFPDYTDSTYFTTDTIHMKDAAYSIIGGLVQTAMAGL